MVDVARLVLLIQGKDQASAELAKVADSVRKVDAATETLGQKMTGFGSKMKSAGANMSMAFTAPIAAIGIGAVKASIDFESAFAGVRKTVDATESEFAALEQGIRNMAKTTPTSAVAIAQVAEAAGALGIQTPNILSFSKVMIDLGNATDLTADQAANGLARIANILALTQDQFDEMGSTLVDLGNKGASTESEITEMALRIAGAGKQIGLSAAEVLGYAAALSNVGINAEAGGTAISRVFIEIAEATSKGGAQLEGFAKIAGMSASQFAAAFKDDAARATAAFIEGLGKIGEAGGDTFAIMEALGMSEIRERDAVLRLAGSQGQLTQALDVANTAWGENSALQTEVEKRYATSGSQLKILWNRLTDVAITLGDALVPALLSALDAATPLLAVIEMAAEVFAGLPQPLQMAIIGAVGFVAVLGPMILMVGMLASAIGGILTLWPALGPAFLAAAGPIGMFVLVVGGLVLSLYLVSKAFGITADDVSDAGSDIGGALADLAGVFASALGGILSMVVEVGRAIYEALSWLNPWAEHSPSLVSQVRTGADAIAVAFAGMAGAADLLETAKGPVEGLGASLQGLHDDIAGMADARVSEAISKFGGAEAVGQFHTAQSALGELGAAYAGLEPQIKTAEDAVAALGRQLDEAKRKFDVFKGATIAESVPFDKQAKAIGTAMDKVRLQINQLKQRGPLTMEIQVANKDGKGSHKETVDTQLGKQVKALEAQLTGLGLKAEEVDLTKKLKIGPMQDAIDQLTDDSAVLPFAAIVKGLAETQKQIETLTPAYEQQNKDLETLRTRYDDIGKAVDGLKTSLGDMGDMAVSEFDRLARAAEAAARDAKAAADKAATDPMQVINDAMAGMNGGVAGAGTGTSPLAQLDADMANLRANIDGFKEKIDGLREAWEKWKPVIGVLAAIAAGLLTYKLYTLAATAATWLFNFALDANPIGLIILAVVGLVAVVYLLITHWDEISEFVMPRVKAAFEATKAVMEASAKWVADTLVPAVVGAFTDIKDAVVGAYTTVVEKVTGVVTAVATAITDVVGFFAGLPGRILGALGNLGSYLFNAGKDLISGFIRGMKSIPVPNPVSLIGKGLDKVAEAAGHRALGGPVTAGMPYWVGERGVPELFVPSSSGRIVPAEQVSRGGGGLSLNVYGPLTVQNIGEQRDVNQTLGSLAFATRAQLRRRGVMV
jgi:TP901 family phage tail tape measure protein